MELERGGKGLNLTLQTLHGILAHHGEEVRQIYRPSGAISWEQFRKDYERSFQEDGYQRTIVPMTLEGCIARVADVISYIGTDIDDAATVGLITWDDVPDEFKRVLGYDNREIIDTLVNDLKKNSRGKGYLEFSPKVFVALPP